jgi:hypothetical protein
MNTSRTYKSFKEIPLNKDTNHVVHLFVDLNDDKVPVYTIKVQCRLTEAWKRLLTTVREREAHGFLRKKAGELNCIWKDHTKELKQEDRFHEHN